MDLRTELQQSKVAIMKKELLPRFLIAIFLVISSNLFPHAFALGTANNVTFHVGPGEKWSTAVNGCSNLPEQTFYFLQTNGQCVTLYKDENCTGDYIALDANHPLGGHITLMGPRTGPRSGIPMWESADGIQTSNSAENSVSRATTEPPSSRPERWLQRLVIKSMGPCFEKCDQRNIENGIEQPVQVKLLKSFRSRGPDYNKTLLLNFGECIAFPTALKRKVGAVRLDGKIEQACIEMHKRSDCSGEFTRLRRHAHNLFAFIVRFDHANLAPNEAVAVSLCGYQCINKTETTDPTEERPIGENTIRLYDDVDYLGEFKDVSIIPGCVNISGEWESETKSIKSNGHCITLYDEFGCRGKSVQIGESGTDELYYRSKLLQNINAFPTEVRSISHCSSTPDLEDSSTPYTPIATSVKTKEIGDMKTSKSAYKVDVRGQKPSDGGRGAGTYFVYLIGIMILVSMVALGVAILVKKYLLGNEGRLNNDLGSSSNVRLFNSSF